MKKIVNINLELDATCLEKIWRTDDRRDHNMVQSEGELDYDDHHRWATRKQSCSWDSLGRVSCDQRDHIKTVEIDTFQPYNSTTKHESNHVNLCVVIVFA